MGSRGENPQKVLALEENEWFDTVRWSPDGQRLAYVRVQNTPERYQTWIETCDLQGASRSLVISDPHSVAARFLLASERADHLLAAESASSDDDNLWQIGVDGHTGTPTGKPKRITRNCREQRVDD